MNKEDKIFTSDLSEFEDYQKEEARELLNLWRFKGLPKGFEDKEIIIMANMRTGRVFLTNIDAKIAMINDSKNDLINDLERPF